MTPRRFILGMLTERSNIIELMLIERSNVIELMLTERSNCATTHTCSVLNSSCLIPEFLIKFIMFSDQLDVICSTVGAEGWVHRLK